MFASRTAAERSVIGFEAEGFRAKIYRTAARPIEEGRKCSRRSSSPAQLGSERRRLVLQVTTRLRRGECRSRVCGDFWPGEKLAPVPPLAPIPAFELPAIRFFRNAEYL